MSDKDFIVGHANTTPFPKGVDVHSLGRAGGYLIEAQLVKANKKIGKLTDTLEHILAIVEIQLGYTPDEVNTDVDKLRMIRDEIREALKEEKEG